MVPRLCWAWFHAAVSLLVVTAAAARADEDKSSAPAGVYQDNVVIVFDASGSMHTPMRNAPGTTRMQAAKLALLKVTEVLSPSTNVGLLVFSSANLRDDWAYRLGPVNQHNLRAAVQSPEPGGVTPLGAYLKKGADALLAQRQAQRGYGTYRLLVVTDGEATDTPLMLAYFPEILARGVTVDVIGVDMAGEHTLAQRANSYRKADDPDSLVRAVSEVFAEVGAGGQQDNFGAEQFAMIQELPTELAASMLGALTETGNQPIGEHPRAAAPAGSAAAPQFPGASNQPQQPAPQENRGPSTWMIILLVIVFIVFRMMFRGKQPPQRRRF